MADRIIYGLHAVGRLLKTDRQRVLEIYLQQGLGRKRLARLGSTGRVPVTECLADELEQLTGTNKHQGVAARIVSSTELTEAEAREMIAAREEPLILVLDGVQDPRNFGACLRTADAAGVDLVVAGRSRNVGLTPVVSKVAAGAAEVQPVALVANLARFLQFLADEGITIVGLAGEADCSIFDCELTGPLALVLGAEESGLRRLTREHCDRLVGLPMLGAVESLNVSVAAGVCLYEARRQRRIPDSE